MQLKHGYKLHGGECSLPYGDLLTAVYLLNRHSILKQIRRHCCGHGIYSYFIHVNKYFEKLFFSAFEVKEKNRLASNKHYQYLPVNINISDYVSSSLGVTECKVIDCGTIS